MAFSQKPLGFAACQSKNIGQFRKAPEHLLERKNSQVVFKLILLRPSQRS